MANPRVLVGIDTADDAGVYQLTEEIAIVQTLDFITPIVDDPYAFGAIAAANSLSDLYAMGATPLTALNIVGYPSAEVEPSLIAEILRGGYDKLAQAGVAVIGGHTVDDPSLKYGVAATGVVHPQKIVTNANAQPGDWLILTKPLGTGIINQGIKTDKSPPSAVTAALESMLMLNDQAAQAMKEVGVNACTDVTGFGLLGHLREMLVASGVAAKLFASRIPVLEGALDLAAQKVFPGGARSNRRFVEPFVHYDEAISEPMKVLLCDPQTSGGLLISVSADKAEVLLERLWAYQVTKASVIGEVLPNGKGEVWISV